ncbi:esterase-like activity of phytase family protein, partial [Rhodopseudomonas sp.]|uniref:esterase-like activity of phytase family protein n=1 Tax=Rhodopseudomonas sp. TaxID=1078 RepID=UPI003B3B2E83
DFGRDGVRARGQPIAVPPGLRKLPNNKGVEALVAIPKGLPLAGTLIAISERGLDADRNILGFLIGGKTPGSFAIRRTEDFDISDATLLPSGDLLILERKFSWLAGVHIRIRRIPLTSIAPGATVDGPALFNADLGQEIDNMEGIDVHRDATGETVLTLISDDNFSMLQRTLLLQFTLAED